MSGIEPHAGFFRLPRFRYEAAVTIEDATRIGGEVVRENVPFFKQRE
jgi:hypothetical protein